MAPTTEENFALGMTLMKVLCAETKENFVFSPLSLGMAFTMLVAGLKGRLYLKYLIIIFLKLD